MAVFKRKKKVMPTKRTMNLYYKPDMTTVPATVSLYVLLAVVLLLALLKVGVYDILWGLSMNRNQLAQLQEQQAQYAAGLDGYDEVRHTYLLYSTTEEEKNQTDRMAVLDLLDEVVRPRARIEAINIRQGQVSLRFSGATLSETAEIISRLGQSPLVGSTTVETARTVGSQEHDLPAETQGYPVTANVLITLAKESEVEQP